jgi:transposase
MSKTASAQIAVIGIDIGKNSFHVVGHDNRGAIILRQKWSRGQVEAELPRVDKEHREGCWMPKSRDFH